MSSFEDRVRDAAGLLMDDRFKALEKLDPDMARRYAIGVNVNNTQRLRDGDKLTGFGRFSKADVDDVLEAALDGKGGAFINKKEEEALMIILASQSQWEPGAKDYMIDQIERNLKFLWSSDSISGEAPQLLQKTAGLDFVSKGDKHAGTGLHYSALDYQMIAGLIAQDEIGAWEIAVDRSYLRLPPGQGGAWGFYEQVENDIYIVKGLDARDRQASFCHEATHAIQDFRNLDHAGSKAKYTETDGYIVQAYVAVKFGVPYAAYPDRPEEVACRGSDGAVGLLMTPTRSRTRAWEAKFRTAYDQVVDAFIRTHGTANSDEVIDMLEGEKEQKRETALLKKMLASLKKP